MDLSLSFIFNSFNVKFMFFFIVMEFFDCIKKKGYRPGLIQMLLVLVYCCL